MILNNPTHHVAGRQIEGVWHTAVVAYQREFFYGGGGITSCSPVSNSSSSRIPHVSSGQSSFYDIIRTKPLYNTSSTESFLKNHHVSPSGLDYFSGSLLSTILANILQILSTCHVCRHKSQLCYRTKNAHNMFTCDGINWQTVHSDKPTGL